MLRRACCSEKEGGDPHLMKHELFGPRGHPGHLSIQPLPTYILLLPPPL